MLSPSDLRLPLPSGWSLFAGADTGTFRSGVIAGLPPELSPFAGHAFVFEEIPNYRYVATEIELLDESVPEWCKRFRSAIRRYTPNADRPIAWCDVNSQFKTEYSRYRVILRGNKRKHELRVTTTREYLHTGRVHLAPWLRVLPYELEHAQWPDDVTAAGKYERKKKDDHTLDCLEHILSRRPLTPIHEEEKKKSFVQQHVEQHGWRNMVAADPHLGPLMRGRGW